MEMTIKGIDSASPVSAAAAKTLYREGIRFSGRYLVPDGWKKLTKAEADGIRAAGLAILLIWEIEADRAKRGAVQGKKDGARARQLAQEMGVPAGTAVYFAVDFCPQGDEFAAVAAYILAAAKAVAPYAAGVYGSYAVVEAAAEAGACRHFWQCAAWSGGKLSELAQAYQYQAQSGAEAKALAAKAGFAVDMDRCCSLAGAGLWLPEYPQYDDGEGGVIVEVGGGAAPKESDGVKWARELGITANTEIAEALWRYHAIYSGEDTKTESGLLT